MLPFRSDNATHLFASDSSPIGDVNYGQLLSKIFAV